MKTTALRLKFQKKKKKKKKKQFSSSHWSLFESVKTKKEYKQKLEEHKSGQIPFFKANGLPHASRNINVTYKTSVRTEVFASIC